MNLGDAVNAYLYALLPFLTQLIICEALFFFKLPRRKLFAGRIAVGLPMLAAAAFLITCVQIVMPAYPLCGTFVYFTAFAFTVLLLWWSFDAPFKILLLYGVAAYAFQNTVYRAVSLLEITGVVWRLSTAVGDYRIAHGIFYFGLLAASGAVVYFLFVRRINAKGPDNIYSRNVMLISTVTLAVTLVLCAYTNAWWWTSWYLSIVNYCFSILSNVFILTIISGMFQNVVLKSEIETVRQLWIQDKRQYEIAKENIDLINIKCHDLKHKIRAMRLSDGELSDSELGEIENAVAIYDSKVCTGCDPIDVLLTEKSLICAKRNINLSCMADGRGLRYMSDSELYSLFGNMLSNAINAVCRIADESRRVIDLTVAQSAGMILINCVNYYDGTIALDGGLPRTDGDRAEHGFGMKSMRLLVNKYGGEMFFTAGDGVFDLKIMLPVREKAQHRDIA